MYFSYLYFNYFTTLPIAAYERELLGAKLLVKSTFQVDLK